MALQIWLPLDNSINNQGLLGNIQNFSLNGLTQNNSGKIGKCYSGNAIYHLSEEFLSNEWSLALWVKATAWAVNNDILLCKNSTASTACQFYFSVVNGKTFNLGINGGSSTTSYSYTFAVNTWYHLVATYDGSNYALYINGNQVKTGTYTSTQLTGHLNLGIGCRSTNAGGTGQTGYTATKYYNDVRIYDHALSIKEVKELSKGLILHYPMNNKYLEETTNLITSEDALSNTCYNGATSKYGYGTNSDIYKIVTIFQGQKGTKVYMGTNGNNARPYSYINDMYVSDGTNKPAYKTLSFDYYTNIGTYISPYKLGSGNGTATWKVFNGVTTTGTYTNSGNIPIETNKWNHIEITFHGTTAANCEWGYIINGAQHVSNTNNFWFYANVQLEEKDHATGYIPYGTHRDKETIELDCAPAGNQNDGTIIGTIAAAADSPRYESSYFFDGVNSAIQVPYNATVFQTNFTINLWFKKTELGSKNYETLFGGPSGFEMDTRSNSSTTLSLYMASTRGGNVFSPFNFNEWYMVTLVNNGTNELYYINSELKKTIEKKSMPTGNYFIGAWSTSDKQNFKGYISDFRVYCTALSAEDIKELYNTAAQVDKDGNVYAYEFKEA